MHHLVDFLKRCLVLAGIGFSICAPACADPVQNATSAVVECRNEINSDARIACYDEAAQALVDALASDTRMADVKSLAVPTEQSADRSNTSSVPDWASAPAPAAQRDTPVTFVSKFLPSSETVASVAANEFVVTVVGVTESFGRFTFTTSDGQVWQQTQNDNVKLPKTFPAEAKIKRQLTGNPRIQFSNVSRSYRVKRIS